MARKQHDVLDDFESSADRLADWVRRNAWVLGISVVLAILAILGIQGWRERAEAREKRASAALEEVRSEFLVAMGAGPGSFELPELANPEAAAAIRADYGQRFRRVAAEHAGTVAGTLAELEALRVDESLGPEERLAALQDALQAAPGNAGLRAIVLERLASAQEAAGQPGEAAATYLRASQIGSYRLRHFALADAARCYAAAGDGARARALYDQLEAEAPDFELPEAHRMLRRELQAAVSR